MLTDVPMLALLSASILGGLLGCLTGLVPGLHSNNVAAGIGGQPGLLLAVATMGALDTADAGWGLVASSAVMACAVAHTVANIVPSVYLAVPEGDTALSVLPGHRMAREGRGPEALRVSVASSVAALFIAVLLVVPVHAVLGPPGDLYARLATWIGPAILAVSVLMVLKEWGKRARPGRPSGARAVVAALGVLLASGLLGRVALFSGGMVGPLFIGLFGAPVILMAVHGRGGGTTPPDGPPTGDAIPLPWGSVLRGTLAGTVVGWFPGVSSAQATVLVSRRDGEDGGDLDGARRFIAGVSAVNTANAVFNLVALATLLRVRSGTASAVMGLAAWTEAPWGDAGAPTPGVLVLLMAAVIGGALAAPVTLAAGRWMHMARHRLSDGRLLGALFIGLLVGVVAFWDWSGLGVFLTATALGMVPPLLGLMRVHLMGAVTIPLALALIAS